MREDSDDNVNDTLDFAAILRDNAGLARMVAHHVELAVSDVEPDYSKISIDDIPDDIRHQIEEPEWMHEDCVSQATYYEDLEKARNDGMREGEANAACYKAHVEDMTRCLRPSREGLLIQVIGSDEVVPAGQVRAMYTKWKNGTLSTEEKRIGLGERTGPVDHIASYSIYRADDETISVGCMKFDVEEIEYLARAMGWVTVSNADIDGAYQRGVRDATIAHESMRVPIITDRDDYKTGYAAGKQAIVDEMRRYWAGPNG